MLADFWSNKIRSLLVIASIAVGLFAVGMISTTYSWLDQAMRPGYAAINPANIIVSAAGFRQDFVDHVRNMPNVKDAEGISLHTMRLQTSPETTVPIDVKAIPDIDEIQDQPANSPRGDLASAGPRDCAGDQQAEGDRRNAR